MGQALLYPFLLLRRRPVTILLCLLAGWVVSVAVDVMLPDLSRVRYVNNLPPLAYALRSSFYESIKTVVQAYPGAIIGVCALIDLGARDPAATPRFADGLRWAAMGVVYLLLIVTPLSAAMQAISVWYEPARESGSWMRSWISRGEWLALDIAFLLRLGLAWPDALAKQRYVLFKSWTLARGRHWVVVGALLPISVGLTVTHSFALHSFYQLTEGFRIDLGAMLYEDSSRWRLYDAAFVDAMIILQAYIFNAATAFVYARVLPLTPRAAAEVF
ncbi:MAG: hypothetical protein ABUS57_12025 [Pseudomonadota bacterium]